MDSEFAASQDGRVTSGARALGKLQLVSQGEHVAHQRLTSD